MYFGNCTPIHVDHANARQTEFGRPLVGSTFTLALVTGQRVTDVSQNVFASLGWDGDFAPAKRRRRFQTMVLQDDMTEDTAESLFERLSDIEHHPDEVIALYKEFTIGAKTYYLTPGGFLYRKDPGAEEIGGFFCGYLSDEVWCYRADSR